MDTEEQCEKIAARGLVTLLRLSDFRNYARLEVVFAEGHNLIVGRNGEGKTNLLEAIYALSTTRSFRSSKDQDVIRFGQPEALIEACVGEDATEVSLRYPRGGRRSAGVFGQALPRVQDLIGRLPAVCFSSSDLAIVSGEPSDRRRFLDTELSLLSPAYLKAFAAYKKALEHRNALLRSVREGGGSASQLEPWEVQLSHSGSLIRRIRSEFVSSLSPIVEKRHRDLSTGLESLAIQVSPCDPSREPDELLRALLERRSTDIGAGMTTIGPHRDDLDVSLDGNPARAFGSQGQQRTAVLAIKLAVATYWRDELGQVPVLLLDDVMSDLDEHRRAMVLAVSGEHGQVIITATDRKLLGVPSAAAVFTIENGTVTRE
jgi:DNA replication and repair protein RecF